MYPTQGSGGGGGVTALEDLTTPAGTPGYVTVPGGGGAPEIRDYALVPTLVSNSFSGSNTFAGIIGDGSGITTLNATNISSGTLADARHSTNIPLKNGSNTFSGSITLFQNPVTIGNSSNAVQCIVKGNAAQGTWIQQWQDSGGNQLAGVWADGAGRFGGTSFYANISAGQITLNTQTFITDSGGNLLTLASGFLYIKQTGTTRNESSLTRSAFQQVYTLTQTGSAKHIDYLINVIETSLGSGGHDFLEFEINSVQKFNVDNAGAVIIGSGSKLKKVLTATATLDFPSIAAGATAELTITSTGAAVNDSVEMGLPAALEAGLVVNMRVSATNTITVRVYNSTAAPIDPASATYRTTTNGF